MRTNEAAKLFYDTTVKKETRDKFIKKPVLPRKRKRPDYKRIEMHFQTDGFGKGSKAHHPTTPEDYYCPIYFDALDII